MLFQVRPYVCLPRISVGQGPVGKACSKLFGQFPADYRFHLLPDTLRGEELFPIRLKQVLSAEFRDQLCAVTERKADTAESNCQFDSDMAEQEILGCCARHTTIDSFIESFSQSHDQANAHSLSHCRLEDSHLLDGDSMRACDWCVDGSGQFLAYGVMLVGALHERAHDRLSRVGSAEEISSFVFTFKMIENTWVTWMADEIAYVTSSWQCARVSGRRIKCHYQRTCLCARDDLVGDLPQDAIWQRQDNNVSFCHGLLAIHRRVPTPGKVGKARFGILDAAQPKLGVAMNSIDDPAAHFSAGSKQGDCCLRHMVNSCELLMVIDQTLPPEVGVAAFCQCFEKGIIAHLAAFEDDFELIGRFTRRVDSAEGTTRGQRSYGFQRLDSEGPGNMGGSVSASDSEALDGALGNYAQQQFAQDSAEHTCRDCPGVGLCVAPCEA
jgi:hypothetical protein